MLTVLAIASAVLAGSYDHDFSSDDGLWNGGTVSDGLLVVEDEYAWLHLGEVSSLSATLELTVPQRGIFQASVGDTAWRANYTWNGGITLAEQELPFPYGHREWVPDDDSVVEPGDEFWDGGDAEDGGSSDGGGGSGDGGADDGGT